MKAAHGPVGVQHQAAALPEPAIGAQLAEIAGVAGLAVDVQGQFEAAARRDDALGVFFNCEHQLKIVARGLRRVKRVRLPFEGDVDLAGQRVFPEQPAQLGFGGGSRSLVGQAGGHGDTAVRRGPAPAADCRTSLHRRAAGRYADAPRAAS